MAEDFVIEMLHITKEFPGIKANDDITLQLRKGEVHALLGENGAGKSTLMSVLFGLYQPEAGKILKNGKEVAVRNPNDANALGIGMVHQHFKLVECFSVLDNIILGVEPNKLGFLQKAEARKKVVALSEKYGLRVDPDALISDISVGMQQRVEILKMLYRDNEILIFDEPTAVLTPQEIDELMEIMRGFKKEGKSILFITHKLNEIMAVADRCTVLRKGKYMGTVDIKDTTKEELSRMMVGRDVQLQVDKKPAAPGEVVLDVQNVTMHNAQHKKDAVKNVSFQVRGGEIVCLAGIEGNGQTEFVYGLTGLEKFSSGKVLLDGKEITNENPIAFNPFYVEDGVFDIEKKESIKTLILTLWKRDDEAPKRSEEVALSNAVSAYIERITGDRSVTPCFNTFYEFVRDEYRRQLERKNVREKDFDIDNFLNVLEPYYRGGEYDYLLNSDKELDLLHKRFIVFELDNIKDHKILFPITTIIIMEAFINKMRKLKGIRKLILIEEAWKAIASANMADYIRYLYKTVRKYFGEAIVVTQEVEDIISSPIVKESIINNSDCKILLDQRKYLNKFDSIQNLLGLTDKERSQILSINMANHPGRKYKEVFFSLGGTQSAVYATEVSLEEYYTYTTEESEKMELFALADKLGGNLELAIKRLAESKRNPQSSTT